MNDLTLQHPQQLTVPMRHELTVADLQHRQQLIQQVLKEIMVQEHHYGHIPGTDVKKMTLLKPGAEKLCATFMLAPAFTVHAKDLPNGHREYRADCTLTHIATGIVAGMAAGSCSTMESKYRWRLGSRKCPDCGADAIRKSKGDRRGFYCWKKIGGCGVEFEEGDQRILSQPLGRTENPDIADAYNTCLKMACKRALVGATLIVTGASDMFATEDDDEDEAPPQRTAKAEPPLQMSPKQELIRDCVRAREELTKAGRTAEGITDLVASAGVTPPKKWSDLQEEDLRKVLTVLREELKLGTEDTHQGR